VGNPTWYGQWVPCPSCRDIEGVANCWSCMGTGGYVGSRLADHVKDYCIYNHSLITYRGGSAQYVINEALLAIASAPKCTKIRREGRLVAILHVSPGSEDVVVSGVRVRFCDDGFKREYLEA
jgi:hypothetical protein